MAIHTKMFWAELLSPATVPDGNSLEERVNAFVETLDPKNVLDVSINAFSATKYGAMKMFHATVIYEA